uniref:SRCR domain-containing protein n=1 Tax=Amphimedon queenslandica TaxID=400682 RepID=A0A1X7SDC7_AMPQE
METSNVAQALIVLAIVSCVTGQRTGPYLYGNTSSVRDGKETVTGIFVNCSDSDPMQTVQCIALCQDNSDNDVDTLCNILGFEDGDTVLYNSSVHGAPPENVTFVGNITCPSEATSFLNCTGDSNSQPFLPDCTEVLVLECFSYLATSSPGLSISTSASASFVSSPSPTPPTIQGTAANSNVGLIAGVSVAAVVVVAAVAVVVAVVGVLVYKNKRKSAVIPISIKPAKS